jgi:putative PIG3 family NAD(P)H quinone oxidoreductase
MRAAVISKPGGPEVFEIKSIDDPTIGPEDVLVNVKATALNRADLLQRRGRYPAPIGIRGDVPGLEMAGVIAETGTNTEGIAVGDRVFGLLGGGGYAEKVVTHHRMVAKIPDNMDFVQAAAVPEVFITAYDALFNHCNLTMGESVLIHAAGSGVGTAAIQLANQIGATTFGTAGSKDKILKALDLGLTLGINYHEEDFAEILETQTNGKGVNVILDVVGSPYLANNLASLALKGRIVIVGTMGGANPEINLGVIMQKRLRLHGTVLRSRPLEEKISLNKQFEQYVLPLLANGRLKAIVDTVFSLQEVSEAHKYMESNANFGKIVLTLE